MLSSTLYRISAEASAAGFEPPAIVGIGSIVSLRRLLASATVIGGAVVLADAEAAE